MSCLLLQDRCSTAVAVEVYKLPEALAGIPNKQKHLRSKHYTNLFFWGYLAVVVAVPGSLA
jgi:hypothetical protein